MCLLLGNRHQYAFHATSVELLVVQHFFIDCLDFQTARNGHYTAGNVKSRQFLSVFKNHWLVKRIIFTIRNNHRTTVGALVQTIITLNSDHYSGICHWQVPGSVSQYYIVCLVCRCLRLAAATSAVVSLNTDCRSAIELLRCQQLWLLATAVAAAGLHVASSHFHLDFAS